MPAYNESERIIGAINKVAKFSRLYDGPVEFIVGNNNSNDNTDALAIEQMLEVMRMGLTFRGRIERTYRTGKGLAVKKGLLEASGEVVLVTDVDLSTPLSEVPAFMHDVCEEGFDMVIGSRRHPKSLVTGRTLGRALSGIAFSALTSTLVPGIRDTQCGFKMMTRGTALNLAERLTIPGFAYDVELIYLARRFGYSVKERPVIWEHDKKSTVKVFRDSLQMSADIGKIWRNRIRGIYPSSPF